MDSFQNNRWYSGSGTEVAFESLVEKILKKLNSGSKLFIGTDSFVAKDKITFASAICIHKPGVEGFYFFTKSKSKKNKFSFLAARITEEVRRTLELADYFYSDCKVDTSNIEIHVDASPFEAKGATSRFSEMLKGYVAGAGYECKLKPYAWASQSVADRHSK